VVGNNTVSPNPAIRGEGFKKYHFAILIREEKTKVLQFSRGGNGRVHLEVCPKNRG